MGYYSDDRRLNILLIALAAVFAVVTGALVYNQVIRAGQLAYEAEEHRNKLTTGLSYLQKIVFPNYDYMMLSYPWMTGAPRASLPLLWVYRIAHRGWTSRTKIPHVFLALKRFRRGEGRNQ